MLSASKERWPRWPWDQPGPFLLSDDPADHGLSGAELDCIRTAYALRAREVRALLEAPQPYHVGWSEFGVGRPKGLRQWLLTVFALPVIYLVVAIVGLSFVPYEYVSHRRRVRREKDALREELATLDRPPFLRPFEEKTLWRLWQVYGVEPERFEESVSVELASAWIARLYGAETLRALRLEERLEQVTRTRSQWRAKHPEIGCIRYSPRLEQVIRELSEELPPYDWARRSTDRSRLH